MVETLSLFIKALCVSKFSATLSVALLSVTCVSVSALNMDSLCDSEDLRLEQITVIDRL